MKRALITGIGGQDGSYLAEQLVGRGQHVLGLELRLTDASQRWLSELPRTNADQPGLSLQPCDITDRQKFADILHTYQPDQIYNLASQSRPDISGELVELTFAINQTAVVQMLEILRQIPHPCRVFQACSSEIFGNAVESPQSESTPIRPRNPYGISKAAAWWHCAYMREHYGMFICNGILYNHESPRRPESFVTRKITSAAARIKLGLQQELVLGDLEARRDWGFAGDTVRAMILMLEAEQPDDYIIATGKTHSVRDLLEVAFNTVGLHWQDYVIIDHNLRRGENGHPLVGNAAKARKKLGWMPEVSFEQTIRQMVEFDLLQQENIAADARDETL